MATDDAAITERRLDDWSRRASHLADEISTESTADPRWLTAVRETPRHLLVPSWYVQEARADWRHVSRDDPATAQEWADGVYANTSLVTALDHDEPSSSSSKPGLMIRMLDALDLHDDHRVLEIGTGTGYNAALLAHRLADSHVYSVDISPDLVDTARDRLVSMGVHPTLEARDGATGWPTHAPYDRILATCSVPRVPWAWAEQTAVGGRVLVDVKIGSGLGTLALLHRTPDGLTGRFLAKWAGFMGIRSPVNGPRRVRATTGPPPMTEVAEGLGAELAPQLGPVEEFLAALDLPDNQLDRITILDPTTFVPAADRYRVADGSWCEIDRGPAVPTVRAGGPTPLVDHLVATRRRWLGWDGPGWDRFGLTVTPTEHLVWLDNPHGSVRWSLSAPSSIAP